MQDITINTPKNESETHDSSNKNNYDELSNRFFAKSISLLKGTGNYAYKTALLPKQVLPLAQLFAHNQIISAEELTTALDALFEGLYHHPVTRQARRLTRVLRNASILPNEDRTEEILKFVVNQCVERSPVPVPDIVLEEFWGFYDELMAVPEMKGLAELNLDVTRFVLKTYEPLLLDLINTLKETRRINEQYLAELVAKALVVRDDLVIVKRQIKAIRHIKPFFQTDPKDFAKQAQIVAEMVREFGPFFIKMAQVAASNADFLPEEIAKELEVFHEDVEPMSASDVIEAFKRDFNKKPQDFYFGFNADQPLKSGSIGSVYVGRRPTVEDDAEILKKVVVKVSRKNLDREFIMGKMVLGLAIITSQYWAPHSKLVPFLQAMQGQVEEFTKGFLSELDFRAEAANQQRFFRRSLQSTVWNVPKTFKVSERILEMEYLEHSLSLPAAIQQFPVAMKAKYQRRIARKLLFTLLEHVAVHKEFHGDLHPGNIMVSPQGDLHLIDWGNTIELSGKWAPVREYLRGILTGDVERLTDSIIAMSTTPDLDTEQRQAIYKTLSDTLKKKRVLPLKRKYMLAIVKDGKEGVERRLQSVMQLMSNTQQMGLVVRGEYMHLSRSVVAAMGSYLLLYQGVPRWAFAKDLAAGIAMFPTDFARDRLAARRIKQDVDYLMPEQSHEFVNRTSGIT